MSSSSPRYASEKAVVSDLHEKSIDQQGQTLHRELQARQVNTI